MSRFIPGDYVRPTNPEPGLPLGSVWVVRRYPNSDIGAVELETAGAPGPGCYPPSYVMGRVFADRNFEKVVMVQGQWREANERHRLIDPVAPDEMRFVGSVTGRISSSAPSFQTLPKADPVASADKLVAAAASTLEAAKEHARKTREEAKAAAKAEAKRKAEAAARAKAEEARKALSAKLHADRCLGEATLALIAEVSRLNNGGEERTAGAIIAAHCAQLQPLARSYGYRIVKPSMLAQVVKL